MLWFVQVSGHRILGVTAMDRKPFRVTVKETLVHDVWINARDAEEARLLAVDHRALWKHKPEQDWIDTGEVFDEYGASISL